MRNDRLIIYLSKPKLWSEESILYTDISTANCSEGTSLKPSFNLCERATEFWSSSLFSGLCSSKYAIACKSPVSNGDTTKRIRELYLIRRAIYERPKSSGNCRDMNTKVADHSALLQSLLSTSSVSQSTADFERSTSKSVVGNAMWSPGNSSGWLAPPSCNDIFPGN